MRALYERGGTWSRESHWVMTTTAGTARVLDSILKYEYVTLDPETGVYTITLSGESYVKMTFPDVKQRIIGA